MRTSDLTKEQLAAIESAIGPNSFSQSAFTSADQRFHRLSMER
jgi:hypothetical protein